MRPVVPVKKRIVLVGGGHSHVTVLRSFGMMPEPGIAVTLIAKELDAPYSGMLPGLVAGHYTHEECHIDLVRLAAFAGARLVHGEVTGIDRVRREVHIAGRPPLAFDLLSIDTGITPDLSNIRGAREHAIPVKPVSTFAPRWEELRKRALLPDGPRRIAVVGAGAAGFEIILAIRHRLRQEAPKHGIDPSAFGFVLIGNEALLPSHNSRARTLARKELARTGVKLIECDGVVEVTPDELVLASGKRILVDAALVTTKAAAPAWFADTGLKLDAKGFIALRSTLQSVNDDDVFAAGDCAAVLDHPREKAGVFAVRQGPPLAANLRARAIARSVKPFKPQRQFLTLLSSGDQRAIAARGPFAAAGAWAWRWKDGIDRPFMESFNDLSFMVTEKADEEMRCGGCAAKIGPATLSAALSRLEASGEDRSIAREDAAIRDTGGERLELESVDFFRAFWPEPYLLGEIAAIHAMSDIHAMGGVPEHAQGVAVLPYAHPRRTEDDLFQLMAGAAAAFEREKVVLDGGHSSEGAELAVGFAVSGSVERDRLRRKGGLKPGDRLVLSKPIGTAILFAALMRGAARAPWIAAAIAGMRRSNRQAADVLIQHGASAMTDVTGFGLAGHVIELLEASRTTAALDVEALPLYPGVADLARSGVASTLLPQNLANRAKVSGLAEQHSAWAILFDPQTSGGLVAGIPADGAEACLAALKAVSPEASIIGTVGPDAGAGAPLLELRSRRP
ncbi:MAG: selenide, water dikinase SelD [Hyphomicrobiaceae bacterium]|nr:MAG: selenide, water dikinase SelD [Hyphomicrobiaceae bacterium]